MRKNVQEALENAIAESGSRPNKSDCVNAKGLKPTGLEYELLLCSLHSKSVHFTVYRASKVGVSGGQRPFMTYQPEKQKTPYWSI